MTHFKPPGYLLLPIIVAGPIGGILSPMIGLGTTAGAIAGTAGAVANLFTQGGLEGRNVPHKKTVYTVAVLAASFFATTLVAMGLSGLNFATTLPFAISVILLPSAAIYGLNYLADNIYDICKSLFFPTH